MIDWENARPVCFVTRPFPSDWDAKYLKSKHESLPTTITLFHLDCDVAIVPTDLRFIAHHRVRKHGLRRWFVDGIEIQHEPDALELPLAPSDDRSA